MNRIRRLPPLFWIGLLPVVILLGLWADSLGNVMTWTRAPAVADRLKLYSAKGALESVHEVQVVESPGIRTEAQAWGNRWHRTGPWGRFERRQMLSRSSRLAPFFPSYSRSSTSDILDSAFTGRVKIHSTAMILPYWLVLLCYLPPWLGLAWWQARRRRKKVEDLKSEIEIGEPERNASA
ncbi:hypothetical protein [Haloferula sp. BvORR071]|uniref:hypothetical protein n=1 Tax=Haloferula sp. BvORR071 TaxID=1396141 RepID=UPI0005575691|nr:hypothetical protein [Haloferula sp. BvORR071]